MPTTVNINNAFNKTIAPLNISQAGSITSMIHAFDCAHVKTITGIDWTKVIFAQYAFCFCKFIDHWELPSATFTAMQDMNRFAVGADVLNGTAPIELIFPNICNFDRAFSGVPIIKNTTITVVDGSNLQYMFYLDPARTATIDGLLCKIQVNGDLKGCNMSHFCQNQTNLSKFPFSTLTITSNSADYAFANCPKLFTKNIQANTRLNITIYASDSTHSANFSKIFYDVDTNGATEIDVTIKSDSTRIDCGSIWNLPRLTGGKSTLKRVELYLKGNTKNVGNTQFHNDVFVLSDKDSSLFYNTSIEGGAGMNTNGQLLLSCGLATLYGSWINLPTATYGIKLTISMGSGGEGEWIKSMLAGLVGDAWIDTLQIRLAPDDLSLIHIPISVLRAVLCRNGDPTRADRPNETRIGMPNKALVLIDDGTKIVLPAGVRRVLRLYAKDTQIVDWFKANPVTGLTIYYD